MFRRLVCAVLFTWLCAAHAMAQTPALSGKFDWGGQRFEHANKEQKPTDFKTIAEWQKQIAGTKDQGGRENLARVIERIATFNRSEAEKLTDDESKDCRAAAMELAKSKEVGPRVSGLVALGKVGDEAAKPLALKAAKGTDPDVKEAGMKLLTRYCDDSTIPVLSAYVVSKGSTLALNAIAEQKTPVAKKALEDIAANAKKPETREAATAALKKRGDN